MSTFADQNFSEALSNEICSFVETSPTRVSSLTAVRLTAQKNGGSIRQAARIVNRLVTAGRLRYVYDCGVSFLEKNYTGVFRLSDRIMIANPGIDVADQKGIIVIRIMPGAAFGDCRHPTTRLSVRAIDFVLADAHIPAGGKTALDIGTGSGLLALTAAALGMERVLATDLDRCARKEARDNILANRLENKIAVSDQALEKQTERFTLITCNLRLPTLIRYAGLLSERLTWGGAAVLSGVREEEYDSLLAAYEKSFDCIWKKSEGGWCGAVFKKREVANGN